jgi:formylmethanofuran dehydrogenase subunit E
VFNAAELLAMSKNCPQCGKVVYFAERAEKDGKTFHGPCLQKYLKEQGKGAKANQYVSIFM